MDKIFKTIGCGYYCGERGFSPEVVKFMELMVPLTRRLWQAIKVRTTQTTHSAFIKYINATQLSSSMKEASSF